MYPAQNKSSDWNSVNVPIDSGTEVEASLRKDFDAILEFRRFTNDAVRDLASGVSVCRASLIASVELALRFQQKLQHGTTCA